MHFAAAASDEPFRPRQHFLRGTTSESEQEYPLGFHAGVDQVGYAVDEGSRLPGACAGDNQQGSVAVCGGGRLLRVQVCGEVAL